MLYDCNLPFFILKSQFDVSDLFETICMYILQNVGIFPYCDWKYVANSDYDHARSKTKPRLCNLGDGKQVLVDWIQISEASLEVPYELRFDQECLPRTETEFEPYLNYYKTENNKYKIIVMQNTP